eukprot:scaffold2657_cov33-Tisochrysis_lutea.AAC.3
MAETSSVDPGRRASFDLPWYLRIQSVLYTWSSCVSVTTLGGPTIERKCCKSSSVSAAAGEVRNLAGPPSAPARAVSPRPSGAHARRRGAASSEVAIGSRAACPRFRA